jgi:Toprim domain-containing protein
MDSSGKIRCPFHDDTVPSATIIMGKGGPWFYCHGGDCNASMGILELLARLSGLDISKDFRKVLAQASALLGSYELIPVVLGKRGAKADLPVIRKRVAEFEAKRVEKPSYPKDAGELVALHTSPVTADPLVRRFLLGRGLSPKLVAKFSLARAWKYNDKRVFDWAKLGYRTWGYSLHTLLTPLVGCLGFDQSVRARCVVTCDAKYKSLAPAGFMTKYLIFANDDARRMLNPGTPLGKLPEGRELILVVTEGEVDYLTWATRPVPKGTNMAVIGLISGSWHAGFAGRIPDGITVVLRTDHDPAGDKYAEDVRASLQGRCRVLRSVGEEGKDENDLLQAGKLPKEPRDGCREVGG